MWLRVGIVWVLSLQIKLDIVYFVDVPQSLTQKEKMVMKKRQSNGCGAVGSPSRMVRIASRIARRRGVLVAAVISAYRDAATGCNREISAKSLYIETDCNGGVSCK